MGLSAWKQYRQTRWALRVNPSSGNLHPTEAYLLRQGDVHHYAPREHALEQRTRIDRAAWDAFTGGRDGFLVAFTSILWREAWKYGERAFRYCQHDTGHALAAMRIAASLLGWNLTLLPRWSDADLSTLLGVDRDSDYDDAEREETECLAVVTAGETAPWVAADPAPLVVAARNAPWSGRANRLSTDHVPWPIIDEVAEATRYPGVALSIPNAPTPNAQPLPIPNSQDDARAGSHSQTAECGRLRCAIGTGARRLPLDARAFASGRAAMGRDRLAAAGAPDPLHPSRRGHDARRVRVSSRSRGRRRVARRDASRIPVGAGRGRVVSPVSIRCHLHGESGFVRPGDRRRRVLQPRHDHAPRAVLA